MQKILISKQSEAENDEFLEVAYYDSGLINQLLAGNEMILSGRKGSGKTAFASYLEKKYSNHNLDFVKRFKVNDLFGNYSDKSDSMYMYILILIIRFFLEKDLIDETGKKILSEWLIQMGEHNSSSYQSFAEHSIESNIDANLSGGIAIKIPYVDIPVLDFSTKVDVQNKVTYVKRAISNSINYIQGLLIKHIQGEKKIIIFIDDLTDYLDSVEINDIDNEIKYLRNLLHKIDNLNKELRDASKRTRIVICLRDDIFRNMNGSNTNKLENNSIDISWNEKMFYGLLGSRITFLKGKNETDIQKYFPDYSYDKLIESNQVKSYQTKFYQFMNSISFNRPRDFLKFLRSMRDRLGNEEIISQETIQTSLMEYIDYFFKELVDELNFINRKVIKIDLEKSYMHELLMKLSERDGFKESHLRSEINTFLNTIGVQSNITKRIGREYIEMLWEYGVLGYKLPDKDYIIYYYMSSEYDRYLPKNDKILFYLHRGLRRRNMKKYGNH